MRDPREGRSPAARGRLGDSSRQGRPDLAASACRLQARAGLGRFVTVCQHTVASLAAVGARALCWLPLGAAPQLPPHQPSGNLPFPLTQGARPLHHHDWDKALEQGGLFFTAL